MSNTITLGHAIDYHGAGLSVIPIYANGTKAPALVSGHPVLNRQRFANDDELRKWFKQGHLGIAVLCGTVSGNAECIDFDRKDIFGEWYNLASAHLVGLIDKLCLIETPRGYHVWYRCSQLIDASTKLAQEPAQQNGQLAVRTLIETRGEGGYAIVPGGPTQVHQLNKPYAHKEGRPLTQLHVFKSAERLVLLNAARAFNRYAEEPRLPQHVIAEALRPGDAFNNDGPPWSEILEPHDWRPLRTIGGVTYWQRPNKDGKGISATTGACRGADGAELFYCFSSNAHPFQPRMGYSKFRTYAILNHAGNLSAAAGALKDDGYGQPSFDKEKPTAQLPTAHHTLPTISTSPAPNPRSPTPATMPGPDESFTAAELLKMKLPDPRWAVNELIPEGLSILAGRPKAGKSWFALHLALEIAQGGTVLGTAKVQQGPVLYLALEDTRRRLQNRVRKIYSGTAAPTDLHLRLRWPRIHEGGSQMLRGWVAQHRPRLVIVDTLAKIRGVHRRTDDCYANDYAFIEQLKDVADKENVAILCLHHTSKSVRLDPVDEISGTLGLSGAADALLVLKRQRGEHECSLFVTGRDIEEEREIAMTADVANKIWLNHGSATDRRVSCERQEILALLNRNPEGLRPRELADLLGKKNGAMRALLWKMTDDGQVTTDNGRYIVAAVPAAANAAAE